MAPQLLIQILCQNLDLHFFPTEILVKVSDRYVFGTDEQVRSQTSLSCHSALDLFHQLSAQASTGELAIHCQVIYQTASAVEPSDHSSYYPPTLFGDEE